MLPRVLAIGAVLAAIAVAVVVAVGLIPSNAPPSNPEKTAASTTAPKRGGVLRIYQYDSPASMSIHEEAFNSAQNPIMAVFNNLVIFDQRAAHTIRSTPGCGVR